MNIIDQLSYAYNLLSSSQYDLKTNIFLYLSGLLRFCAFIAVLCVCTLVLQGCAVKKSAVLPNMRFEPVHRIAVLPFDSSNPYIPGSSLSDMFTVRILQTSRALQVIERKDLIKILQEQKLTLSGIIRPDKFSRLGSILGVDAILIGSVQTLETIQTVSGSISVTIKLMDVTSGKVIWADRQKTACAMWSVREIEEVAETLMEKSAEKMVKRMEKNFEEQKFSFSAPGEISSNLREAKLAVPDTAR